MALQKYANGKLFVFNEDGAGGLAAEAVSFTVDYATNDNAVSTLADGFAGVSPGAETTTVSVENAIPRTGIEFDYFKWAKERKIVEITGYMGASKISLRGYINQVGANVQLGDVKATFQLLGGTPETD